MLRLRLWDILSSLSSLPRTAHPCWSDSPPTSDDTGINGGRDPVRRRCGFHPTETTGVVHGGNLTPVGPPSSCLSTAPMSDRLEGLAASPADQKLDGQTRRPFMLWD